MRILNLILCVLLTLSLVGCGKSKWIDGKVYGTYGLFNEKTRKNSNIEYELSTGNVIWSIILIETIVFPVYFVGFSLYNPICKKGNLNPGVVNSKD